MTHLRRVVTTESRSLTNPLQLAYGATLLLSSYWRTLIGKDLKLLSASERVSAFLLALAPRDSGPVTVTLPGGRRLVAGQLGAIPQSLSRAFAALHRSA